MTTKRLFTPAVLVVLLVAGTAFAQANNPLIGTWKLNVAKSKGTTLKGGTTTIEAAGAGVKFIVDFENGDGTTSHWTFSGNFDGKDNRVTGDSPYGDAAALTRINARTTRIVTKREGKVVVTQTIVVSADGKTRTVTSKGTDAKGQPIDSISLYEKQ
jgi:hypothetical protein